MRTGSSRARRALITAASIIMSAVAVIAPAGAGTAEAAASPAVLRSVQPCRLLDTRESAALTTGQTTVVQVTGRCGVPAGATAAVLTLTVVETSPAGFMTAWPSDQPRPWASTMNWDQPNQIRANSAVIQLSGSGSVSIFAQTNTQVVVDVSGAFVPASSSSSGRFMPLTQSRIYDSRPAGRPAPDSSVTIPLPAGVPADAAAVAVTLTTTSSSAPGFFTAYPAGTPRPWASVMNTDGAGQTRSAGLIVPVTSAGLSIYTQAGDAVIVDIAGYFTGGSAPISSTGLFVASNPTRLVDTREQTPELYPGGGREFATAAITGSNVAAVVGNWTITATRGFGYTTAFPARAAQPVVTTTANDSSGQTVANLGVVPVSSNGVAVYSSTGTQLVVDITGWFTGSPVPGGGGQLQNVAPGATFNLTAPSSPDSGAVCASDLSSAGLSSLFSQTIGSFYGADYQRAYKLPDGRVLWMFQDAFITQSNGAKKLTHNVGMIQSGRCFTLLRAGTAAAPKSWIMWDRTVDRSRWYWPMGGEVSSDGQTFQLMMAEMNEYGATYLSKTAPSAMYVVSIRLSDLAVVSYQLAPNPSPDLYGFSATSDASFTYLYSNCYKQFGWGFLGMDPCTASMKLARVPKGNLLAAPQYWTGSGWSPDAAAATPVITPSSTGFGINPAQIIFDGVEFRLVMKESDWFGTQVVMQRSSTPYGPWTTYQTVPQPLKCPTATCNTYFASWVPWTNPDGSMIWGLSHNRWDGAMSSVYRPTFHAGAR